jgi:hypothetical protein
VLCSDLIPNPNRPSKSVRNLQAPFNSTFNT